MSTPAKKRTATHATAVTPPWIAEALRGLPAIVTLKEASAAIRVSTRTLRRQIDQGRIRTLKATDGGPARVLIPRAELGRLLSEMVQP